MLGSVRAPPQRVDAGAAVVQAQTQGRAEEVQAAAVEVEEAGAAVLAEAEGLAVDVDRPARVHGQVSLAHEAHKQTHLAVQDAAGDVEIARLGAHVALGVADDGPVPHGQAAGHDLQMAAAAVADGEILGLGPLEVEDAGRDGRP